MKLLVDSKLTHLQDKFNEENIDIECLLSVSNDQLKELVPKMGDRMRLGKNLKIYRQQNELLDPMPSTSEVTVMKSTSTADTIIIEDEDYDLLSSSDASIVDSSASNSTSQENIPNKKMKLEESSYFMDAATVKEFLEKEITGRAILNSYIKSGNLTSADRRRLTHLIVDGLLERHQSINKDLFSSLADDICKIFPSECRDIYFLQFNNGKRNITSGKLVDRYRNQRHYVNSRMPKLVTETPKPKSVSIDTEAKMLFLQHSTEPWTVVLEYWNDTIQVRQDQRLIEEPAYLFLEKWPTLKHSLGYLLVSVLLLKL